MTNPFRTEQPILNDRFLLITEENEFRMSLWVKGFGIIEAKTGTIVIPLLDSFHLIEFEEIEKGLKLKFEIFPDRGKSYEAEINLAGDFFIYNNEGFKLQDFYETFKVEGLLLIYNSDLEFRNV
jgi:hypothetical protein